MAREQFKTVRFSSQSRERIDLCNEIISDYLAQGLKLTLRQLYYQLVTRNVFPNSEKSYKTLGSLLNDARLAGRVDWDAIEDRVRRPKKAAEWENLTELVESALYSFRLPRWQGQDTYAELWVEKDALAGVLEPLAHEYHVTLMVNRGYSSASAMYEASKRFMRGRNQAESNYYNTDELERAGVLLYLGDHDPSGEDMVRDIRDRLETFGVQNLTVEKIALTTAQVQEYNPPPNPAKMSDSRAAAYVAKHGAVSWEVDALPPNVLARIVRDSFQDIIDVKAMNKVKAKEEEDKKRLRNAVANLEG